MMDGADAARRRWERSPDYVSKHSMHDIAWDYFLEEAAEYEGFHDDDGGWLEGLPDKLDDTKEWEEYCDDFCHTLDEIQESCREWDACGQDPYLYYGVRRSDFA